jgi:hypothetical protein
MYSVGRPASPLSSMAYDSNVLPVRGEQQIIQLRTGALSRSTAHDVSARMVSSDNRILLASGRTGVLAGSGAALLDYIR